MNVNDKLFDRIVNNMTDVRLYEEGVQVENRRIMHRHRKRLRSLLTTNLKEDVKPEITRFGKELKANSERSLREFSTSQLDFHSDNLNKAARSFYKVNRPRTKELLAEITGPSIRGPKTLSQNLANISSGELVRIQTKVRGGLARGLTQKEIITDVLKTTKITEIQARTLTRTSITSTQTAALNKVMQDNKEILSGYMFTAILDSRTSSICSFHNGKTYKIDDLTYRPPLHWNCRSSMIPVMKSKDELALLDSARIKQRAVGKLDVADFNGKPPMIVNFTDWLKRQPSNIQEKLLGSADAASLFQQGRLKAAEFITPKGRALTIQALRAKAAISTAIFRPSQTVKNEEMSIPAKRPSTLLSNPRHRDSLREMFILDSNNYNSTMALTNFKGTTLVGKQASRRRVGNQFDERNFSSDPLTGEVKNNLLYDPDFNLYQERIDFMRNSKDLTPDQKDFIESTVAGLDDKISLNQQTVAIENLRVVFQRYNADKEPWGDFVAVMRAENRFSVQNVSRLLDTRSRRRSEMFVRYLSEEKPQVQIMGKYYDLEDLTKNQLADQRFIDAWRRTEGKALVNKMYFSGRAPMRSYFARLSTTEKDLKKFKNKLLDSIIPLRKAYREFKKRFSGEPKDSWWTRQISKLNENIRYILDFEFLTLSKAPKSAFINERALESLTKVFKLAASGQATDYDSLAISIGKTLAADIGDIFPGVTHTLKSYHAEGSKVLQFMKEQNLIRINFRGKARRGVFDVDTGRVSGGFGDTVSREVQVIDKTLLKLQEAERRNTIARRLGTVNARDRLYVKAGKKTFVDARGNETGIPIISANKFADYDPKQIDTEMAQMMNHVMNVEYSVDNEFFDFMDSVTRFRDPRGNSKYFDSINEFRHEILNRGEQGYGLMTTAKYHRLRQENFRTQAFIDSRGRVYHRGYLTPTGGELVRPFLNSGTPTRIDLNSVRELEIQIGALLGPATEALTQSGRRAIFRRNAEKLREIGGLLQATTQRDRRIREFLEHPLIRGLEGAEVGKLARMALEYKRIFDHVDGDMRNPAKLATYKTRLMIENDASSSGAQIIALSTGDRPIAMASNVLATTQKNRLYDLVAQDTINDPEFLEIAALRNANLTWEDMAKAAKNQNMVTFYGAGEATKTAKVSEKLSGILQNRGFLTITKGDLTEQLRLVDNQVKVATRLGATTTVDNLTAFRKELIELVNNNQPVGRGLLKEAMLVHPDSGDFVEKIMNARQGIIGPKDFEAVSRIMSKNLSQRAPVTETFITFWKRVARSYVSETQKVDIPWVTFDGKIMMQRYRPKLQERIDFTDPVTGRRVQNIYEASAEDGKLLGKGSLADASIGLGVNGNHSNDAVIVRRFHLWGLKNNVGTGTIHDAFFTNIADAQRSRDALRTIYADALGGDTIRKTLAAMRKEGMSNTTYQALIAEAKSLGLIDPDNAITRADILAPIKEGEDWYGIGP
jgi:SPP1 gp7 family putative phage head morphogenesis protein